MSNCFFLFCARKRPQAAIKGDIFKFSGSFGEKAAKVALAAMRIGETTLPSLGKAIASCGSVANKVRYGAMVGAGVVGGIAGVAYAAIDGSLGKCFGSAKDVVVDGRCNGATIDRRRQR